MWRFVLKSPMLFRVRDEYVEQIKILEKFCFERHTRFADKLGEQDHLFEDLSLELFDDLREWTSVTTQTAEDGVYEGEKKIKLDIGTRTKLYTLSNYFETLTRKYLFNALGQFAFSESKKYLNNQSDHNVTMNDEKLMDMVLKYFEYTPSFLPEVDQEVKLYFKGMAGILDFLAGDLIELSWNHTKDADEKFVSSYCLEVAVVGDLEWTRSIFYHMNHLPIVDFNYFYGANQASFPSINVYEVVNGEVFNFTQLPTELHYVILQNIYSLEDLLEKRLVCKQWNYFILNDNYIWKKLICNNMISEDLFRFCDSSFNVNELESIIDRGKHQKPLYFEQQVINYFLEMNDWKSLYFILVRRHLSFIRDLDIMKSKEFFEREDEDSPTGVSNYENSKKKLQIGISNGFQIYPQFTKYQSDLDDDSNEIVKIPKDSIAQFMNIGNNFMLIGIIDFSKLSSFISSRLLPTKGLLYCFHGRLDDARAEFHYFENYSLEESDKLTAFQTNEETFTIAKPTQEQNVPQEQVMVNLQMYCEVFSLQRLSISTCYLAPTLAMSNFPDRPTSDLLSHQEDTLVLYSANLENDMLVSVFISIKDLKLRKFENAKVECLQLVDESDSE